MNQTIFLSFFRRLPDFLYIYIKKYCHYFSACPPSPLNVGVGSMSDFKQDMLNKSVKPIKVENNSITGQMNHSHTTKLLLMGCSFQIKRKHWFPLKGFVQFIQKNI